MTRDRRGDVGRRVAETDGEDFGSRWRGQETRAERHDTSSVCGGAFWEDDDDALRMCKEEGFDVGQSRAGGGVFFGLGQGAEHGSEEGDGLDLSRVGVGDGKDGVKYGG